MIESKNEDARTANTRPPTTARARFSGAVGLRKSKVPSCRSVPLRGAMALAVMPPQSKQVARMSRKDA